MAKGSIKVSPEELDNTPMVGLAVEDVLPWEIPAEVVSKDTEVDEPKSWFKTGAAGFAEKKKHDTVLKLKKEKSAFRFYLKPEDEAIIVFVDSIGLYLNEHSLKLNGKWGNYITCIKDVDTCEVCNTVNKNPDFVCYYTIIDTRKYNKRDGTTGEFTKCLLRAKGKIIDKIEDMKKRNGGSLDGLAFRVKRYDEKDFSTGSDFERISENRVSIATKFGTEAAVAFDYKKLLAPPTKEELASLGFGASVIGSVETTGDEDNSLFS